MGAEIDCVAIAHHNAGVAADEARRAMGALEASGNEDFRPMTLFPDVKQRYRRIVFAPR
jgi:hypothetical protein